MTRTVHRLFAALSVVALLAAACSDDATVTETDLPEDSPPEDTADDTADEDTPSEDASDEDTPAEDTPTEDAPDEVTLSASFRGVTETTIELGIAYVDFQELFDLGFIDFTHGDSVAIWEALIADVNAGGGVLGRELTPIYDTYLPIGATDAEESCLIFTEDNAVFAVLGLWVGESVLCLTDLHETIHVGHLLRQEWVDKSRAPLVTSDTFQERELEIMLDVLLDTGRLADRTVGVLSDTIAQSTVDSVVKPFADANAIALGTVGVLDTDDADTVAILAQLQNFTERWRLEEIDLLLIVGNNGVNYIDEVNKALDDIDVAVPSASLLRQVSGAAAEGDRHLYEGTLSMEGLSATNGEQFDEPLMKECIGVVEAAIPDLTVVHPGELQAVEDWFQGISDACTALAVFVAAATAAGPELTNDSFEAGLESLGSIDLPGNAFSSFGPGKHDANDGFRLVSFDPLDGDEGSFAALTDIVDTAGGG